MLVGNIESGRREGREMLVVLHELPRLGLLVRLPWPLLAGCR